MKSKKQQVSDEQEKSDKSRARKRETVVIDVEVDECFVIVEEIDERAKHHSSHHALPMVDESLVEGFVCSESQALSFISTSNALAIAAQQSTDDNAAMTLINQASTVRAVAILLSASRFQKNSKDSE